MEAMDRFSLCCRKAQDGTAPCLSPTSFPGRAGGGGEPGLVSGEVSPLEVTIALSGSQLPWKQAALQGKSSP